MMIGLVNLHSYESPGYYVAASTPIPAEGELGSSYPLFPPTIPPALIGLVHIICALFGDVPSG